MIGSDVKDMYYNLTFLQISGRYSTPTAPHTHTHTHRHTQAASQGKCMDEVVELTEVGVRREEALGDREDKMAPAPT